MKEEIEFGALEEEVARSIELITLLREEKAALERQVVELEAHISKLREELRRLRTVKEETAKRVEAVLERIDIIGNTVSSQ